CPMAQVMISPAVLQFLNVLRDVEPGRQLDRGQVLAPDESHDGLGDEILLEGRWDGGLTVEGTQVGNKRMRPVENPELDLLVLLHLVGHGGTAKMPGGAAGPKIVLDDPHRELLGSDRRVVADAQQSSNG